MQVGSSNGSLQNRYLSETGNVGGIHLPVFNNKYVFSKKKSSASEEEYRGRSGNKIMRILQKDSSRTNPKDLTG